MSQPGVERSETPGTRGTPGTKNTSKQAPEGRHVLTEGEARSAKPSVLPVRRRPKDGCAQAKKSRRRSTLPRSCPRSTIDAKELNGRVRDGIGCGLFAVITGKIVKKAENFGGVCPFVSKGWGGYQAERPLVQVC